MVIVSMATVQREGVESRNDRIDRIDRIDGK